MKIVIAVALSMACGFVLAKDNEVAEAAKKTTRPAAAPSAKKALNSNVGSATAKPFFAGGTSRNPFDVPLFRDARTFDNVSASPGHYVLR
jgi:hypothetical protein